MNRRKHIMLLWSIWFGFIILFSNVAEQIYSSMGVSTPIVVDNWTEFIVSSITLLCSGLVLLVILNTAKKNAIKKSILFARILLIHHFLCVFLGLINVLF